MISDGGNIIITYGCRGWQYSLQVQEVCCLYFLIISLITMCQPVHLKVCALRTSCSWTNLATQPLFLLNRITTVPESVILFMGPVPGSLKWVWCAETHMAAFFPLMKPLLEINGKIFFRGAAVCLYEPTECLFLISSLQHRGILILNWKGNLESWEYLCCR